MAWPYEISQAIIDFYKREFVLKHRAAEFDVADLSAFLRSYDVDRTSSGHDCGEDTCVCGE